MRKLKLQMQVSVDGFVAGPEGQLDWMTWNWDDELKKFVSELTDSMDTILLGRKMTAGFVNYWESVKPDNPEFPFAKKMVDAPKIVFSKTQKNVSGINTSITNADLTEVVNKLKSQSGKGIIVYGGAGFVASLIDNNLIDEFYLFMNPTAIGNGMKIFSNQIKLQLLESTKYECGIVLNKFILNN